MAAVSGYGQPEDREKSRRAGFDAHVVKPVEIDELRRLLVERKRCGVREGLRFALTQHFPDLRGQGGRRERLLQEGDLAVLNAAPGRRVIGEA